jgi:hypothetical protein
MQKIIGVVVAVQFGHQCQELHESDCLFNCEGFEPQIAYNFLHCIS